MKKLLIFNSLVVVALIVSCSTPKQKHKLYGKWELVNSPKVILNFQDDDSVSFEKFAPNDIVYKQKQHFVIIDEKTAEIIDNTQPEYKCRVRVFLQGENEIRFDCQCQKSPEGRSIVDLPEPCTYKQFKKVE